MKEINTKVIDKTHERAQFFQNVQVWPLTKELNYVGWLNNFKSESDKKIACLILDFFSYFSSKMVDQMLISSLESAGHQLSKIYSKWVHTDFVDKCYYSFIPGENPNPTDSGHIFTRKLRDVLEIPENRIIDYNSIPRILEGKSEQVAIILVDDFVGSGSQCYTAWNETKNSFDNRTLRKISEQSGHIFIYAPLIVNHEGHKLVREHCPGLIFTPTHVFGPEYNLFNKECYCWHGDNALYEAGVELILRKSAELGIPSTNGRHTQDEKGFGAQGLAIKFEHGAPDAVPAIFYWCHEDWTPLFKKAYNR